MAGGGVEETEKGVSDLTMNPPSCAPEASSEATSKNASKKAQKMKQKEEEKRLTNDENKKKAEPMRRTKATASNPKPDDDVMDPRVAHGSSVYALRGLEDVLLFADGQSGKEQKIDKTRVYGTVGAVMTGLFADYDVVDRHLRSMRREWLLERFAIERFAREAYLSLLDRCPDRPNVDDKAKIIFVAVEENIPRIWIGTRETFTEIHEDFVAEGSGGHIVEMFLLENEYSAEWSLARRIAIGKRAMVAALADPHTGGMARAMKVTSEGVEFLGRISATELVILEAEREELIQKILGLRNNLGGLLFEEIWTAGDEGFGCSLYARAVPG